MSSVHGSWGLERFDDGTTKLAGEIQLKKYGLFLDEYATQLKSIETALEDDLGDAWDFGLDPITLDINPFENVSVPELIRTDNKVFNKVTTVLAALCIEMDALVQEILKFKNLVKLAGHARYDITNIQAETRFYSPLLLYEEALSEEKLQEGEAQVHIAKMLPLLQDIANFVQRSYEVIQNVVQQLAKIYTKDSPTVMDVTNIRYLTLFEHLGSLLRVMITLDKIINGNVTMQDHWRKYKRMLKTVNHNVETFNMDEKKIRPFEKLLFGLEGQVLQGRIFENCMNLRFDGRAINVTRNILLSEEFINTLKVLFNEIESRLGESNEINQRQTFVGVLALFVMHYRVFRSLDRKFFKQLFDVYKKIPGIHLAGTILLFPDEFLVTHIPDSDKIIDKKTVDMAMQARNQFLVNNNTQLSRLAQNYYLQISSWMLDMDVNINGNSLDEVLSGKAILFIKGVKFAYNISHFIRTTMNLHIALEKPMTKSAVLAFCRLIELLKSIQYTFHRRSMYIAESVNHIVQHFSFKMMTAIDLAKKRSSQDKKLTNLRLDIIAALELLKESLNGPGTLLRMMVVSIAMHVAYLKRYLKDDEYNNLIAVFKNVEVILDLKRKVLKATDCTFLMWHMVIFPVYLKELYSSASDVNRIHVSPVYLKELYSSASDVNRIHYMLSAYQDCVSSLKLAKHEETGKELIQTFKKQIVNDMQQNILLPLCKDIETDLRLSIHQHLQLDDRNPFKIGLQHIKGILEIKPIKLFNDWIDIKGFVTHYLDRTFYNNNTVALHDWKTYTEMRNLASQKYMLQLPESYLPSQTLEQGLDVLEIMRNIHVFVAKYCYNLNNQVFIERASNNKHLNTINIRHIANSIRTHGSGIMNTTVNFTYQFLRKKFFIFSQFLYDEHIKARLIKDIRYFKDAKEELDQKYPFDRAEKFNKGIRKLGVTSDGQSYLDQFRELIIQIGNAMGYIRLIRSGGLHCASNAIRFVPDLEEIVDFKELTSEASLSSETIEAASNVDLAISNLTKNFAQGTDYLKMLVDVFAAEFQDAKNIHLNNFYMILPPMTLNFVEHAMSCKEKVNKKNKLGACFTDDGFVMGVAYILKLLDQYNEFDSLHWFKSVNDKYNTEKNETMKNASNGKDEKLVQTMNLRLKRLMSYQKEFELVYYSMRSARIFFRAGEENPGEDKPEENASSENNLDSTTQS